MKFLRTMFSLIHSSGSSSTSLFSVMVVDFSRVTSSSVEGLVVSFYSGYVTSSSLLGSGYGLVIIFKSRGEISKNIYYFCKNKSESEAKKSGERDNKKDSKKGGGGDHNYHL